MSEENLSLIDHIRNRPGMYIGELNIYGLKTVLGYLFDDILKHINVKVEFRIEFKFDNWISFKVDNLETEVHTDTISNLKSLDKFFGFGFPVIIALSEKTQFRISKSYISYWLNSIEGTYSIETVKSDIQKDGIEINFKIDDSIFSKLEINYEVVNQIIKKYALINPNCCIISIDSRTIPNQLIKFDYPNGISHQLDLQISRQPWGHGNPILRLDFKAKIDEYEYQVCLAYNYSSAERSHLVTYANTIELVDGGSLEDGILEGLEVAFNQLAVIYQIEIDNPKIRNQLSLIAVAKGDDFTYQGATRTRLSMPKLKDDIKQYVAEYVYKYLSGDSRIEQVLYSFIQR